MNWRGPTMRLALPAAGLFLLSAWLYGASLDRYASHTGDEAMHVPNAYNYAERGHLGPDNWYHPPLKHLLTRLGIAAAGDTPVGWRLRNVVTGAGTVVVVFLLAEALLGSLALAVTAALLLAFDPLQMLFARSTYEDVPATFFALLGLLFAVRHHRTGSPGVLFGAGIALGVAVALRSYMALLLLGVAGTLLVVALRRKRPAAVIDLASGLGLVPLAVFLAVWLPWFRRGYGVGEWLLHQRLALGAATSVSGFASVLMRLGHPWKWFVGQVGLWFRLDDGAASRVVLIANDPPVWLLVLPATAAMAFAAWRERRWEFAAVPAAFALLYVPFLAAGRPIFVYSALALLPFAFIAVAFSASRVLGRWTPVLAAAAVLWGLYLRPLIVGAEVILSRYRPILERIQEVAQ